MLISRFREAQYLAALELKNALIREYMEETQIKVKPLDIIGIRFNMHDWYIAFRAEYVSGDPSSDNEENSDVLWVDVKEALDRDDVSQLTKKLILSAIPSNKGLSYEEHEGNNKYAPYSLYCI